MPNSRSRKQKSVTRTKKKVASNSRKKKASRKKAASTRWTKRRVTKKIPRKRATGEPKVLVSPGFQGRPKKLARDTYPEGDAATAFVCFCPPVTKDGEFESARICDMGCFTQDGRDSNKYYHAAVVQHRKTKNWYTYFEWGRTGGSSRSFQFVACQSEEDARAVFAKQLHTKNDKRGEWVTIVGIRTLRAKKGKDCYLVRPLATRTTGLPDARNIGVKQRTRSISRSRRKRGESQGDPRTTDLLHDLRAATVAYTRKSMADSSIPTQSAIDDARSILGEAQLRIAAVDEDIDAQVSDESLMRLTELMFCRIPRKKKVGAAASTWMLTQDNIQDWKDDLDAFESALRTVNMDLHSEADVLAEMNLEMQWIDPESRVGSFLYGWCPHASVHRHKKIRDMVIKNVWEVNRHAAKNVIPKAQQRIFRSQLKGPEKPLHQPKTRVDLPTKQRADYRRSNTAMLFHGTRGVNVNAILRESLRLPETLVAVPFTGAKFGPGIYFADDWKKAADYTNVNGSAEAGRKGTVRGRAAFLFVADVVLGKPYVPKSVQGFKKPPRGHHSVFGKVGHSGVSDNEFAIYKSDQSRLRYLIEFSSKTR